MVEEIWVDADGREHLVRAEDGCLLYRVYCPNCHGLEWTMLGTNHSIEELRSDLTARGWSRKEETK